MTAGPARPRLADPMRLACRTALALVALGAAALAVPHDGEPVGAQSASREWRRTQVRTAAYPSDSMLDPRGLDDDGAGSFYVADSGRDRIVVVSGAGAVIRSFGHTGDEAGALRDPGDVAVDPSRDRVYVADRGNRRVSVFTLAGQPVDRWLAGGPEFALVPWAVSVSAGTGDVYVLSRLPWGRVDRFAGDGRWLSGWGSVGGGPGEFRYPEDLAVAPDGRVLVADTNNLRVQVFDPAGNHLASWTGLEAVHGVEVDPVGGTVYALLAGSRVQVLGASGNRLGEISSDALAEPFAPASRIGVGAGGRLALTSGPGATDGRQGLRQYDRAGALAAATVADPRAHPESFRPSALAVGPAGDLLVADPAERTTRRYAPDGTFRGRLNAAVGHEIVAGDAGDVFVLESFGGAPAWLRHVLSDDGVEWETSCTCFAGAGLATGAGRLYVTHALSRTVGAYASGGVPQGSWTVPGAPYAWPIDVARGPDGRLFLAGGADGGMDVLDAAGRPVGRWSVGDGVGVERVDVAPDGAVFGLLFDGSIAVWRPDGSLETRFEVLPAAPAAVARPRDLAAGPDGRLYVLDGHTGAILVYEPGPAGATPVPSATPESPCTVSGDKTASPTTLTLGEETTVRLSLAITCPPGSRQRADIVLVLDRSNSMAGSKLDDAKAAAAAFVRGLDLTRHRAALVSFSDSTALDQALTGNATDVLGAIARVLPHGGTDIAVALDRADLHLQEGGRPDALPVVLLLTDGQPSGAGQPYVDPVRLAARVRARGGLVYTIGLGANVDQDLLVAVAGAVERYFFAPGESDLAGIYAQLSATVGGAVATDLQVVDRMGPDVDYVPGSASGRPVETAGQLAWTIGAVPAGGLPDLTFRVRPRIGGRVPTNAGAEARYTVGGSRYSFTFPVPEVVVVAPPTATITPTPTSTPPPTGPSVVYLPLAASGRCFKEQRLPADVVLVLDTSSSMQGEKVVQAAEAASYFVRLLEPTRDRVGLVTFDAATRRHALTADRDAVLRALAAIQTGEGTRIDLGLGDALAELRAGARPDVARVVVLLTDGQPSPNTRDAAVARSDDLRRAGAQVYAIGLGPDADADLLRRLADSPAQYFHAPVPPDLAAIYDRIAVRLPCR